MPPGARDPAGPIVVDGAAASTSQSPAVIKGDDAETGAPTALDEGCIAIGGLPPGFACNSQRMPITAEVESLYICTTHQCPAM